MKNWYVVYSKPRWEKKVHRLFEEQGITSYCPLNKVHRRWSDRMKRVEVPLFSSYVFVHIEEKQKLPVRETPGVINFIYQEGKPAVVKESDIDRIKKFLSEFENVELEPLTFEKNQRVVINRGLFVEEEGKIIDFKNRKVKVAIDSLGYLLVAIFNKSELIIKQ